MTGETRSLLALAVCVLAGCGDPDCPAGTRYDGYRCAAIDGGGEADAGDAAIEDAGGDAPGEPDGGSGSCGVDGCDLAVSCSPMGSIEGLGDVVTVEWTATNLGASGTTGPFTVELSVWREDTSAFERTGDERHVVPLAPGESVTRMSTFLAPGWFVNGNNDLKCVVDAAAEVPESDEGNNEDAGVLITTGLPDLLPAAVSIGSPLPGTAGSTFGLTFELRNEGKTAAPVSPWLASAGDSTGGGSVLSRDPGFIAAGATLDVMEMPRLTYTYYGSGTVLVRVDASDVVPESDDTNNDFTRTVVWE